MKVVESPSKDWVGRRIWLDVTTIGLISKLSGVMSKKKDFFLLFFQIITHTKTRTKKEKCTCRINRTKWNR